MDRKSQARRGLNILAHEDRIKIIYNNNMLNDTMLSLELILSVDFNHEYRI